MQSLQVLRSLRLFPLGVQRWQPPLLVRPLRLSRLAHKSLRMMAGARSWLIRLPRAVPPQQLPVSRNRQKAWIAATTTTITIMIHTTRTHSSTHLRSTTTIIVVFLLKAAAARTLTCRMSGRPGTLSPQVPPALTPQAFQARTP
jgi:hypothetical protein